MRSPLLFSICLLAASAVGQSAEPAASLSSAPKARVENAREMLHGQQISDPYRWLENTGSAEVQEFIRKQSAHTGAVLQRVPQRKWIEDRLQQMITIGRVDAPELAGPYFFYTRRDGKQNQPVLYVREGANGNDRVLVDPNQLAADGTVSLDWWYPSHQGKYFAYGTSPSGSEVSTLHVLDVASGKPLPDSIERTRAATVAWLPDNSGFYYARYPKLGDVPAGQENYNRRIFLHKLGTDPARDPLVFGEERDPQDWPNVYLSEGDTQKGRWLLVEVQQGYTRTELYLKDLSKADSAFLRLTDGRNSIFHASILNGELFIRTNDGAPRYRLMRASAERPEIANWKEVIPESKGERGAVLDDFEVIAGRIVAQYTRNASSEMRVFGMDGKPLAHVGLPSLGTVADFNGKWDGDAVYYMFHTYTTPPTVFRYDLAKKANAVWAKVDAPIDPSKYEVKQLWFNSKDGTEIPMFVVHSKGIKLDGKNPTLMYGYGGFNSNTTPVFYCSSPNYNCAGSLFLWLDSGGVFAAVNLRGGSEFGENWHRAGMLERKQNVFDDFISAGEYLIAQKYTNSSKLAAYGRSNGGLLATAVEVQRPELFAAIVAGVPLTDMLRYQDFLIARLWVPEYGSAENPEQFKYLRAYSPYHNVKDGVKYPATLIFTADTDTRVHPLHSLKFAARLQAATASGQRDPVLLRIERQAGHGAGKPLAKQIQEFADIWSFLFWQLEVKTPN